MEARGIEPLTPRCKRGVFPLAPRPRCCTNLDVPPPRRRWHHAGNAGGREGWRLFRVDGRTAPSQERAWTRLAVNLLEVGLTSVVTRASTCEGAASGRDGAR